MRHDPRLIPLTGLTTNRHRRWLGAVEFTRQQALLRIGRAALLPQGTLSAALAEHRKSVRPLHKALPILR